MAAAGDKADKAEDSRYMKVITYSDKYMDNTYEYRHVFLPKSVYEHIRGLAGKRLLTELEWRNLGVQQSRGWEHYTWHKPEPHILMYRRPLGTDPNSGEVSQELKNQMLDEYQRTINDFGGAV